MAEYSERRTIIEDVPVGRRPVVEQEHDTVIRERRGMSGAAIAALVIAAIAAAVLITLMIMNGNQQSREAELARQRDQAEAAARAAQSSNQQQPTPPVVVVSPPQPQPVPVPVPAPSASQPAPSASQPAPSTSGSAAPSDASIEVDVTSRLLDDAELRANPVDVKVSNGTARLSGEVPNEDLKMRAEKMAKTVKGVRRVVNDIKVAGQ